MIRMGVIGTGRAGLIHARNFATSVPGAGLARLIDPDESSRLDAARELGLDPDKDTEANYREELKEDRLDAVVIATPTAFHKEIAIAAAAAGKHVLCEKPMALDAPDCDAMIAACEAAGVKLQIGFMRRFDAGFRDAWARVQAGEIGDVVHVRSLTHGPSTPKPWMYDISNSNGPLAEVNSHDIDTLRWFTGDEAVEVYAMAGNYRSPKAAVEFPDFYDQIHLSLKFQNGAQGSISGAQGVKYAYDARAEIIGTEGILFVGGIRAPQVVSVNKNREIKSTAVESWRDLFAAAYLEEDRAFVRSIRDDSPPMVTGIDGKEAVRIVVAGNRSAKQGNVIHIDRT